MKKKGIKLFLEQVEAYNDYVMKDREDQDSMWNILLGMRYMLEEFGFKIILPEEPYVINEMWIDDMHFRRIVHTYVMEEVK